MSKFKIGDRVWNIGSCWIDLEEVEITSERKESNGILYYITNGITVKGVSSAKEVDLFHTQEGALAELYRRNELEVEKISSNISTTEDLLKMMLECMLCEEYTDWNKIKAAKRKAKELLGIEL